MKKLEEEHLHAIEDIFGDNVQAIETPLSTNAKLSTSITVKHIKGFAEWIDSQNEGGGLTQLGTDRWYIVDEEKDDVQPKLFAKSTIKLIELYFNSLEK